MVVKNHMDAACGSGEGTYEVAEMLLQLGFRGSGSAVEGSTLEPLELLAAAHGWFPHDRARSTLFRKRFSSLVAAGGDSMIRFYQEDLCCPPDDSRRYDLILCNGLLGGPLLHEKKSLAAAIDRLAIRLNPGGVLLASDHFHQGWHKKTPPAVITGLLAASGLKVIDVGEGVGGVRI